LEAEVTLHAALAAFIPRLHCKEALSVTAELR
jgi:hypothetical protein